MMQNVSTLIDGLKTSELGKATRKSAQVIWKANVHAWNTTRGEFGKVAGVVVREGSKLTRLSRDRTEEAVEALADAANERAAQVEERFQTRMRKVIHDIGLPTADEVDALTRKVDQLSKKVQARKAKPRKRVKKTTPIAA